MIVGAAAGAAAGAAVIAVAFAVALVAPAVSAGGISTSELAYGLGNMALFSTYAAAIAFMVMAPGILIVGVPAWLLLHRAGRTGRVEALIAGGVLAAGAPTALVAAIGDLGDPSAWISILIIGVAGMLAGLTFRRVIYGRAP